MANHSAKIRRMRMVEDLRGLVYDFVGLPRNPVKKTTSEAAKKLTQTSTNITRITHQEIQAMRTTTAKHEESALAAANDVNQEILRTLGKMMDVFRPRLRRSCALVGHECLHCGRSKFN